MKKILPPIAIYLCFIATYIGISMLNNNDYLFRPVWDVQHYLDISLEGYKVYPCTPGIDGNAGEICGNPGWLPMWPLVVAAVRSLSGGSSQWSFISLSFLFSFFGFILLYRFTDIRFGAKCAIFTAMAMICSPAAFYLITGFPYALFFSLFMIYLFLLYRQSSIGNEIALFLTALAISLTYPTGILIALIPIIRTLFNQEKKFLALKISHYLQLLKYAAPFILGLLLFWIYFQIKFDDFFLQLHFQEKYHRTLAFPLWILIKSLFGESLFSPENIVLLWYGLIFIIFYPFRIARELWIMALVFYLFSLTTGTTMSIYRHYLIIFPAYMMIGTSSRPLWLKLVWCIIGLAAALIKLFPEFMAYQLI